MLDRLRRAVYVLEMTWMNVLGTVAVCLVDRQQQTGVADIGEDTVDPDPAAGGELDDEHADRLLRSDAVQRITGARYGVDAQFFVARFEETGSRENR